MFNTVTIREFEYLSCGNGGQLTESSYRYLRERALAENVNGRAFLALCSRGGTECLQVTNWVGVLSTPDGTVLEVLPKHTNTECDVRESRRLLWKMLRVVHDIEWSPSTDAMLHTFSKPLPELLIMRFLHSVSQLVRRGIRSDYQRVKRNAKYLKGRLDVTKQLRRPPGNAANFCIEFDEYSMDRAENRLIRLALERLNRSRLGVSTTRLSKELSVVFSDVPPSQNINLDFTAWREQRDMSHYQAVKPWLDLILRNLSPWSFSGEWQGISMLFPMEQLFEKYLAKRLKADLLPGYNLTSQAASEYLTVHNERRMFQLKPDFLVKQGRTNYSVLDAKWKLLDQSTGNELSKYNVKQADLYQLFAYGHKYLNGEGELLLIYPLHESFNQPLPRFEFESELSLWIVPFDLESDRLVLPQDSNLECFGNRNQLMVA